MEELSALDPSEVRPPRINRYHRLRRISSSGMIKLEYGEKFPSGFLHRYLALPSAFTES
jgi:hypothetical protein